MVRLAGGPFLMGTADADGYAADGEGPVHRVALSPFWIDRDAVTNARFGAFVAATGFVTAAEQFGWSFVFGGLLPDDFPDTRGVASAPWWRQVFGADWTHPEGPHSDLDGRAEHPVVHVSWDDAVGVLPRGPVRGCPRRPSGSTRRAGGSSSSGSRGAPTGSPVASTA